MARGEPVNPSPEVAARLRCMAAIVSREVSRFIGQRARLMASIVRPLLWLAIFAAGFRATVGLTNVPPYPAAVAYEVYIVPGLVAMIQLFNGLQSSLSLVYDREMGTMKILLISPHPRWFLLACKLVAGTVVSILLVLVFLLAARLWAIEPPPLGYLLVLPVLLVCGLTFGALGLALSVVVSRIENFAGVMNFVVFPIFFASSALYPLAKIAESSTALHRICASNPFTHAVEAIRFALYGRIDGESLAVLLAFMAVFFAIAVWGYSPDRPSFNARRG